MDREVPGPRSPVLYDAATGRVPLAVAVVDQDGRISHWSSGAGRLFGVGRHAAIGSPAAAAVAHARRANPAGSTEFAQLDLVDAAAVAALHDRIGDAHVYLRAVIHQSEPEARPAVAAAVATLVGKRGRAFVTEPTPASKDVLRQVAQGPDGPPEKLRRVLEHGLRPAEATEEEVRRLLGETGLTLLADGAGALVQTAYLPDGTRVELPARWFVLGRT
ncbi:SAM-dependent methyltransferase [Streptomyces sp. NPDC001108]